jgi:hypothetical protein
MQSFPVSRNTVTPVASVRSRTMPTPQVQKTMVMQPVNLRPLGNTVSMSVRAENPFTAGRPIRVVTQASGGMAKADATQRTQARFLPIGGLGADPVSDDVVAYWYRTIDPDGKAGRAITPEKDAYWRAQAQADADKKGAAAAAQSSVNWSKAGDIFASTVSTGVNIAADINKTKQLALQAQIADSNKRQAEIQQASSQAFWGRATDVSQYGAGMMAQKQWTIPLLAIGGGALAIALFLFLKKKRAAAAPAA